MQKRDKIYAKKLLATISGLFQIVRNEELNAII